MTPDWMRDLLAALAFSVAMFTAGVAFAVYRALDWVDRMRAWAASVQLEHDVEPPPEFLPTEPDWILPPAADPVFMPRPGGAK